MKKRKRAGKADKTKKGTLWKASLPLSDREIARITGVDRASVKKWTAGITDDKEKIRVCEERRRSSATSSDAEASLSWFQQKAKEETLRLRRVNETEEAARNREWMATKTHHEIISLLMNQLEQLPGKAGSQLGLDARQVQLVQRLVDDVRLSAAQEIEEKM